MATSLTISAIQAKILWAFSKTENWGDSTAQSSSHSYSVSLAQGTGADQADRLFVNKTTIAAGSTTNLDLAGSLTDVFGSTITFARIKTIYFELTTDTTASSVTLGGHASASFRTWLSLNTGLPLTYDDGKPGVIVRNGGCFLLHAPDATAYAVTATTQDILLLTNNDGSNIATYKIALVGCSA